MNRHEQIMELKELPKNINKKRINQIFKEYRKDCKKEKKSNFKVLLKNN